MEKSSGLMSRNKKSHFSTLREDHAGQPELGVGRGSGARGGGKGRESHLAEPWTGLHSCDYRREVSQEQTQLEIDPMRRSESESKLNLFYPWLPGYGTFHYVNGLKGAEP